MRTAYFFVLLVYITSCTNKTTENKNESSDFKSARSAFHELNSVLELENGELWNHSLAGPVLLVNRSTRDLIANEIDTAGALTKQGNFYVGKFPENYNIANTAVDWNGKRWTLVALPLPEPKQERINLLVHESFHRIQPFIGFDSLPSVQNSHLDSKVGRIYLKLELEALKSALSSKNPNDHIKNALLFRLFRQSQFPDSKYSENSLEINEGLAEFTGSMITLQNENEIKEHYTSQIDFFYTLSTYVRSFAYFTTPVYGYYMSLTDNQWNLKINRNSNLTDFTTNFFDLKQTNIDSVEIAKIGLIYGIDSIVKFENTRELQTIKRLENYRSVFQSDCIVSINLEKMKIGFDPSNITPLDSLGTVYPNLRITDNWGTLKVDSCGALINQYWNNVTISYPETINDTVITGRGWTLNINQDWMLVKNGESYSLNKKP